MSNAWSAFYWRDYVADTGHLTLAQHGAYLLLMAHYYTTGRPLPANASVLHRVCRCTSDADRAATEQVLKEFFTLEGDVYRHKRVEKELSKAADISEVRRNAANARYNKKRAANAPANAVQMHTQPQPQLQSQPKPEPQNAKARARAPFKPPSLVEVKSYCDERKNHVNPEQWFDHYTANGWMRGRTKMQDWKAAVRIWERNGVTNANGNGKPNRAQQRQASNLAARDVARAAIVAGG
jgi:uncharacterized protein YdaU (DUF1376 family)